MYALEQQLDHYPSLAASVPAMTCVDTFKIKLDSFDDLNPFMVQYKLCCKPKLQCQPQKIPGPHPGHKTELHAPELGSNTVSKAGKASKTPQKQTVMHTYRQQNMTLTAASIQPTRLMSRSYHSRQTSLT